MQAYFTVNMRRTFWDLNWCPLNRAEGVCFMWGPLYTGFTVFREEATTALAGFHAGPLVSVGFSGGRGGRKTGEPGKETTTNLAHMWHKARIEPRPHWWEMNALTTAHPPVLTQAIYLMTLAVFHYGDFTYNMMRVSLQ